MRQQSFAKNSPGYDPDITLWKTTVTSTVHLDRLCFTSNKRWRNYAENKPMTELDSEELAGCIFIEAKMFLYFLKISQWQEEDSEELASCIS